VLLGSVLGLFSLCRQSCLIDNHLPFEHRSLGFRLVCALVSFAHLPLE
jgi:hypothetical protein